jgi:NAD(P)-dependent dehydrogenase (short-subunit alcohol dehydrogenase family)
LSAKYLANSFAGIMQIKGRAALVTGGTKGIGAATAVALAKSGANVAIVGRNHDADADGTRQQIEALGSRAEVIVADCSRPVEAVRCVTEAAAKLGRLDVLVHSAGGPVHGKLFGSPERDWCGAFDIHVHAIFHLRRAAIPLMKPRGGAVILVSSTAGLRAVHTNIAYQVVKGCFPFHARPRPRIR